MLEAEVSDGTFQQGRGPLNVIRIVAGNRPGQRGLQCIAIPYACAAEQFQQPYR